jgi:hypothetical protein
MKNRVWAAVIALPAVGMTLSHAHAACQTADLDDGWDAYAIGSDFDLGDAYWQRCSLRIDDRGDVRSGSCRDHLGQSSTLSSSDFALSRSCRLTGSFEQTFDDFSASCEIRATLSADKQIASGVGQCDDGDLFVFNMVRR